MTDYYSHPGISNSKLGQFRGAKSPAHYKEIMENGWKETPAMAFGSFSHTILFEPQKIQTDFYVLDRSKMPFPNEDFRNAKNKAWKKEQEEINAGKQDIDSKEMDRLQGMQEALLNHEEAFKLIMGCDKFEEEFYWTNEMGLSLKKKVDGISSGNYQIDYKTCQSSDPKEFRRHAFKYGYHNQAGFYFDEKNPLPFYFIAQEKEPPYAVSVFYADDDFVNKGIEENHKDLIKLKCCIDADMWPGHEIKMDDFNSTEVKPFKGEDAKIKCFVLSLPDYVIQNS